MKSQKFVEIMPTLKGYWQAKPSADKGRTLTRRSSKSLGVNRREKFLSRPNRGCRGSDKARQGLSRRERWWTEDTRRSRK
ncbi:hypothetical protein PanWU01x14_015190, partial [Parasponia andersonii]